MHSHGFSEVKHRSFSHENVLDSESGYGSSGHPGSSGPTGSDQGQSPGDRRSRLRKSHSSEGLLRSPQTGPPHPPAPLAEDHHQGLTRASLNTFDDATAE